MARRKFYRAGVAMIPDATDSYLQPKPYLKIGLFRTKSMRDVWAIEGGGGPGRKPAPSWSTPSASGREGTGGSRLEFRAAKTVDKAHRKLLEASGTRYEVLVRKSTRMRSAGKTSSPAQAQRRAIAKGGVVHDHYEGRVIFVSPSFKERFGPKDTPPDTTDTSEDDGTWEVSA